MKMVAAYLLCTLFLQYVLMVHSSPTGISYSESFLRSISRRQCRSNQYKCAGTGVCIAGNFRCDGHQDCSNGDDEVGCTCNRSYQMQCLDGSCIDNNVRCNNRYDCRAGEDELHCKCPHDKFKCAKDGNCILLKWKCDGFPHCYDKTDEEYCQESSNIKYKDDVLIETLQDALRSYLETLQVVKAQTLKYED